MAAKIRTFIAVDIGSGVLGAIGRELPRLIAAAPDFKWVATEKMHLTLSFLGDLLDRDVPEICRAVTQAVQGIEEFEVEIVGLGGFPHNDRPRVVWAGVDQGRQELCELQAAVAGAVSQLGFPSDRDVYTPHLTLARAGREGHYSRDLVDLIGQMNRHSFGVTSVDEVVVYASYREKTGPNYVPMAHIELAY
jgi:2'-5' RNA ligase